MCWRLEIWAPPWSWLVRPASPKCVPAYPRNCFYTGYRPIVLYRNTLYYIVSCVPGYSSKLLCPCYLPIFRRAGQPIHRLSSHIGRRLLRLSSRPWARCRGDREGSLLKRISALIWRKNTKVHNCFKCKVRWERNTTVGSFVFLYSYLSLFLYLYLYPYSPLLFVVFVFVFVFCCLHCVCVPKFLDCNAWDGGWQTQGLECRKQSANRKCT